MEEVTRRLQFNNFVELGEHVWFWDVNYNILFKGKIDTEKVTPILKSDKDVEGPMYSKIAKVGDMLVGIPCLADKILLYDTSKNEEDYIPLPALEWSNENPVKRGRFFDYVISHGFLFLVGFWSSYVVKVDVEKRQISGWVDLLGVDQKLYDISPVLKHATACGSQIIVTEYCRNRVYKVDADSLHVVSVSVPISGSGYSAVACAGEYIWLAPRGPEGFVKWNLEKDSFECLKDYPAEYVMHEQANISEVVISNGKLWSVPYRANAVLSIDLDTNEMSMVETVNEYYEALVEHYNIEKYALVQKGENDTVFFFCNDSRSLLEYNTVTQQMETYTFELTEKQWFELGNHVVTESDEICLSDLIARLEKGETSDDTEKEYVGNKIYDNIVLSV